MVISVSVKDSLRSQYLLCRHVASSRDPEDWGRDGSAEGAVEEDSPSESVLTASRLELELELEFVEDQDEWEVKQELLLWLVDHAGLAPRQNKSVGDESIAMP